MSRQSELWLEEFQDELAILGKMNISFHLQSAVTRPDRTVKAAVLNAGPRLALTVGLRSSILEAFERFLPIDNCHHMPCDIPGLVTGVALITTGRSFGIVESSVSRGGPAEVTIVFEADDLKQLSRNVFRALRRWDHWLDLLKMGLSEEPVNGNWSFEWQEFLAGESGYYTKEWYESIPDESRMIAIQHLKGVSKAILRSLLRKRHYSSEMVVGLTDWLDDLQPLPYVIGYEYASENQGVLA